MKTITKFGSLPSVLVKDSVKAVWDKEKVELFNEYFYSVFTDVTTSLSNLEEVSISSSTISEVSLNLEDIIIWRAKIFTDL